MGGVVVIQPQDYLNDRPSRQNITYSNMKSRRNPNPSPSPNLTGSNRRKRSPTGLRQNISNNKTATVATNQPAAARNLVMGQVKILKRGEALNESKAAKDEVEDVDDLVLSLTDRLGPEPVMTPKKMVVADFYAGSAFFDSPPPSSLPLPAFFIKKDDPTTDLRRILGLHIS